MFGRRVQVVCCCGLEIEGAVTPGNNHPSLRKEGIDGDTYTRYYLCSQRFFYW